MFLFTVIYVMPRGTNTFNPRYTIYFISNSFITSFNSPLFMKNICTVIIFLLFSYFIYQNRKKCYEILTLLIPLLAFMTFKYCNLWHTGMLFLDVLFIFFFYGIISSRGDSVIMPDYKGCITNLACSVMKYFELETRHNGLDEIDDILSNKKPRNVVVILCDGMGFNIMNRALSKDSFLVRNTIRDISSVVPSTTTAATTSMLSGLNPCEHGWLGWDLYVKPEDKIVTLFKNKLKDRQKLAAPYNVARKYYGYRNICEQINDKGKYRAKILFPFGNEKYFDLNDMLDRIYFECKKDGKKYIYAYYEEPDYSMHEHGVDSDIAITTIKYINEKIEEMCSKLDDDTLVIVTADHGHYNCSDVVLSDYKDFFETLDGDVSIEDRMCSMKVKEGKNEEFVKLFNEYFGSDFILKRKDEILDIKLFGDGIEHPLFRDSLGDYFALAVGDKYMRYSQKSDKHAAMHAGFTEDEMRVPLIVVAK